MLGLRSGSSSAPANIKGIEVPSLATSNFEVVRLETLNKLASSRLFGLASIVTRSRHLTRVGVMTSSARDYWRKRSTPWFTRVWGSRRARNDSI